MDGPGYTEEEWVGNPETLSGERYIWNSWAWLTRTADGKLGEYDFDGLYNWPGDPETDGGSNPNFHPLDPDSLWSTDIDGRRWYMRDIWAYWFGPNGGATFYPTLRERRMKEMGCFGIPLLRTNGACCTFSEFGTASCATTTSSSCQGVFTPGRDCSGPNPCGGGAPNPVQQKEAMDMVMSLLKRK